MKRVNYKKLSKIFTILMLIATIACALSMLLGTTVFADGVTVPVPKDENIPETVTTLTGSVLNTVAKICYATAVILVIFMGLNLMKKDSAGDVAKVKTQGVVSAIGAVLVFGAGVILQTIASAKLPGVNDGTSQV